MVFLPSTRYGSLSVERSNQPRSRTPSATRAPQSVISPSSSSTSAPSARISSTMGAGVSRGTTQCDRLPAAPAAPRRRPPAPPHPRGGGVRGGGAPRVPRRGERHLAHPQLLGAGHGHAQPARLE